MTHPYIPATDDDRAQMLAAVGASAVDDLFADVPAEHRDPALRLLPGLAEADLVRELEALAARNQVAGPERTSFLGAGAYRHFIPAVVGRIVSRGEFATSYTPYQAEISQGTLQAAFEFQSLTAELLGMDVANAGMYDGASALAEACLMACAVSGRSAVALSNRMHPDWADVVRTYAAGQGIEVEEVDAATFQPGSRHACLAVQQPDFFGCLEADPDGWAARAHAAGALLIVAADPISLGLVRPPGAYGADIAVCEGQPLGVPLSFGGPYVGLFACRRQFLRQMPGRIVGRTKDVHGRTGYVLTLQTREQHIRRERATSNICTSEQLVALAVTVYLCAMGKQGLRRVAELCYHRAHYAAGEISKLTGYSLAFDAPFFKEFVVRCPVAPAELNRALLRRGIIGGLDVSDRVANGMLLCVTEMNCREDIDRLLDALSQV